MAEYKYLLHITVLGSENVGKKTFAKCRFLKSFREDHMLTMGAEISSKTVEIDDTIVRLAFRTFSDKQFCGTKLKNFI